MSPCSRSRGPDPVVQTSGFIFLRGLVPFGFTANHGQSQPLGWNEGDNLSGTNIRHKHESPGFPSPVAVLCCPACGVHGPALRARWKAGAEGPEKRVWPGGLGARPGEELHCRTRHPDRKQASAAARRDEQAPGVAGLLSLHVCVFFFCPLPSDCHLPAFSFSLARQKRRQLAVRRSWSRPRSCPFAVLLYLPTQNSQQSGPDPRKTRHGDSPAPHSLPAFPGCHARPGH